MSSKASKLYSAPALDKGLEILEYLARVGIPQSQGEIADALGRSPNEFYRMLARLEARHYLLRDESSGKYRLSLKLFQMSRTHSPIAYLREAAHGPMRRLAELIRHSCHLGVIDLHQRLLVVLQLPSPEAISLSIAEGSTFSPLQTASGRLLVASCDPVKQQSCLQASGDYLKLSKSAREAFRKELAAIARPGYLIESSRLTQGVSDISVLVGAPGSNFLAALTVSCISSALTEPRSDAVILQEALKCARQISEAAGML